MKGTLGDGSARGVRSMSTPASRSRAANALSLRPFLHESVSRRGISIICDNSVSNHADIERLARTDIRSGAPTRIVVSKTQRMYPGDRAASIDKVRRLAHLSDHSLGSLHGHPRTLFRAPRTARHAISSRTLSTSKN
jgi:hypothetical protein